MKGGPQRKPDNPTEDTDFHNLMRQLDEPNSEVAIKAEQKRNENFRDLSLLTDITHRTPLDREALEDEQLIEEEVSGGNSNLLYLLYSTLQEVASRVKEDPTAIVELEITSEEIEQLAQEIGNLMLLIPWDEMETIITTPEISNFLFALGGASTNPENEYSFILDMDYYTTDELLFVFEQVFKKGLKLEFADRTISYARDFVFKTDNKRVSISYSQGLYKNGKYVGEIVLEISLDDDGYLVIDIEQNSTTPGTKRGNVCVTNCSLAIAIPDPSLMNLNIGGTFKNRNITTYSNAYELTYDTAQGCYVITLDSDPGVYEPGN